MVLSMRLSSTVCPFDWSDDNCKRCLLVYATKVICLPGCKHSVHVDEMARIKYYIRPFAIENIERG